MKKIAAAAAAAVIVVAVAAPASAQNELNAFGAAGTLAIDAQGGTQLIVDPSSETFPNTVGMTPFVGWSLRSNSQPRINNGPSTTYKTSVFYLNPGADYFVINHLSIGGEVLFAVSSRSFTAHPVNGPDVTQDEGNGNGTHWGFMPRVGYDIVLSSLFSFWPRGGFGFRTASFTGGGSPDLSLSSWFVYVDLPFLLHIADHFFIGVGPGVTATVSSSRKQGGVSVDGFTGTDWRLLSTTIGGYF